MSGLRPVGGLPKKGGRFALQAFQPPCERDPLDGGHAVADQHPREVVHLVLDAAAQQSAEARLLLRTIQA